MIALTIVFSVVASSVLVSFYLYRKFYALKFFKDLGIPGPVPHWLFGNLRELWATPDRHLVLQEWSRKYGHFYGYFEGGTPVLVTSSPEAVEQICVKQFSSFQGRHAIPVEPDPETDMGDPVFTPTIVFARGSHWKRLRTISNTAFSTGKLKSYMPAVEKSEVNLMKLFKEKAKASKSFNIHAVFQLFTLDVIGQTAFGIEMNSLADQGKSNVILPMIREFLEVIKATPWSMVPILVLPEVSGPLKKVAKFLAARFHIGAMSPMAKIMAASEEVVKRRLGDSSLERPDLLQSMIELSEMNPKADVAKDRLTFAEVLSQCMTMFAAGTETTSTTLSYAAYLLAQNPDVQQKLHKSVSEANLDYDTVMNLPYLDWVCHEVLRLYPIGVKAMSRFVMDETQVSGVTIPRNSGFVLVDLYSIHQNPELWGPVDPAKFYPERFSPEYMEQNPRPESAFLAFGFGPKICVGMRLALLEFKLTLAYTIKHFRILEREGGYPNGLPLEVDLLIVPAQGVEVRLEQR